MTTITLGRRPTLGEVIEYYTQESFLRFLLATIRQRRVVLVVSKRKHWEPNWEKDEVVGATTQELRRGMAEKLRQYLPGIAPDDRPDFYPAFHQQVETRRAGEASMTDCVFEADLPTWRDAFQDVSPIVTLLDRHAIPYQHKFSGHRSLHIVLPGALLPNQYRRGKHTARLARSLIHWSGSQAHYLARITRMPYSLNEDSGLVCLPIAHGELARFRPWQANLHLVEVPKGPWQIEITERDRDRFAAIVETLDDEDGGRPAPVKRFTVVRDPEAILAPYTGRLRAVRGEGIRDHVWQRLGGTASMDENELLRLLHVPDDDVRWLAAEAYLLHGRDLSKAGIQALMAEEDEYATVAATDVLLRFESAILPTITQQVRALAGHSTRGLRTTYLLAQSPTLRQGVFDRLLAMGEGENLQDVRLILACLTGAVIGDWERAEEITEPVKQILADDAVTQEVQASLRTRLRALAMMRTLEDWDKDKARQKAHRLGALGPGITDLLLIAAGSPNRLMRRGIVAALAELSDPRSIDLLISALDDEYTKVRREAISALVRIGAPAVDALLEATGSDQDRIRRYSVLCLGHISKGDAGAAARAKPAIVEALHDSEPMVRRQAIRALEELATEADIGILLRFLREAEPDNALEATSVLEALGEPGVRLIEAMALKEHNPAAAYYIAQQGDQRGRKILVSQLDDDELRDDAVEFLRELRDARAVPYLAARLREETDWHGMFTARELGVIAREIAGEPGSKVALASLIEALERDNHLIRRGALRGLAEARTPKAIPALIRALEDEDGKARGLATGALLDLGEAARAPLEAALAGTMDDGHPNDGRRMGLFRNVLTQLEAAQDVAQNATQDAAQDA